MAHMIVQPNHDVDLLGRHLAYVGRMARSMPPSWDGAHIAHPYVVGGRIIGRVLPGRGLYLNADPQAMGMTHLPPYVYPRSVIHRLVDVLVGRAGWTLLNAERGAIITYDSIINGRANGKANDVVFSKLSYTTVANVYSSTFRAGGFPVAGTYTNIPGGAVHTRASTGALNGGMWNPTAPDKKYLLTFGYTAAQQINMSILADLLVAAGNINANLSTVQTVNSTAQTRQYGATLGAGVLMTYEVTTALGATASNLVVTYTNQAGTAGQVTPSVAMTGSAIVNRLQPVALGVGMELASGDTGVRSVESFDLSAAMGGGVLALNLYYPLSFVPGVAGNAYAERDSTTQVDGLSELDVDGSDVIGCLVVYVLTNTTSTGVYTGFMRTVAG